MTVCSFVWGRKETLCTWMCGQKQGRQQQPQTRRPRRWHNIFIDCGKRTVTASHKSTILTDIVTKWPEDDAAVSYSFHSSWTVTTGLERELLPEQGSPLREETGGDCRGPRPRGPKGRHGMLTHWSQLGGLTCVRLRPPLVKHYSHCPSRWGRWTELFCRQTLGPNVDFLIQIRPVVSAFPPPATPPTSQPRMINLEVNS